MPNWHMTETGQKACSTTPERCPIRGRNGEKLEHMSGTEEEAREYYAQILERELAEKSGISLSKPDSNYTFHRPESADQFPQRFVNTNFADMTKVVDYIGSQNNGVDGNTIRSANNLKKSTGGFVINTAGALGFIQREKDNKGGYTYSLTKEGKMFKMMNKSGRDKVIKQAVRQSPAFQDWQSMKRADFMEKYGQPGKNGVSDVTASRMEATMTNLVEQVGTQVNYDQGKDKKDFHRTVTSNVGDDKKLYGEICTKHWIAKSLTGVCDLCED